MNPPAPLLPPPAPPAPAGVGARRPGTAPLGLPAEPSWTAEGDDVGANLGYALATAGDITGDGWDDFIVGAPGYMPGFLDRSGAVFVFHGEVAGPGPVADWQAQSSQFGYPLNYDQAPEFGAAVAGGDWNCDGYADVAVGMPFYNLWDQEVDEGAVFVWYGAPEGLGPTGTLNNADWRAERNQSEILGDFGDTMFGHAVANAGDVNGDGCDDLIVGAPGYDWLDPCGEDTGAVFVWYGSPTGLGANGTPDNAAWTASSGGTSGAHMGYAVGGAGDVNGDGYGDVIVGADALGVYVWHGAAEGLGPAGDRDNADWKVEDFHGFKLGAAAGPAGDVNGDGYADVIVGAPLYDGQYTDEGQARVYLGSADGLEAGAAWTLTGGQAGARFGFAVGAAGQVNDDAYADILVGAPDYDNGQADAGRAYLYDGAAGGPLTTPSWTAESDQAGERFGSAVGTAGNVGGAPGDDVLVGAPGYDNGQTDEGRAYAYLGANAPFQVWVEVQPGRVLTLTTDGWYTPNPVTYRVHVLSERELDLQGALSLEFPVEEPYRETFLTFIPQANPGGGQTGQAWDCQQEAGLEHCELPIVESEHVAALEEHVISWTVWLQPMAATTLHGAVDLAPYGQPEDAVHARAPDVVVPQARIHPVVIIPGALGTFPPVQWGPFPPKLDPIDKTYVPLHQYLEVLGYKQDTSLYDFPYNWMLSVTDDIAPLAQLISTTIRTAPGPAYVDRSQVDLVTHSMGGLIARAYVEREGYANDVHTLITLATPHQGIPGAYLAWEGNQFEWLMAEHTWLVEKVAIALHYCPGWKWVWDPVIPGWVPVPYCTAADMQRFTHTELPSMRDVLPTEDVPVPYLVAYGDPLNTYPITVNDPLYLGWPENPFLKDLNSPGGPYDLGHLTGTSGLTVSAAYNADYLTYISFAVVNCFGDGDCSLGPIQVPGTAPLWMHGIPVVDRGRHYGFGDSLVLTYSAQINTIPGLEDLNTYPVDGAHQDIPRKWEGLWWLAQKLLGLQPPHPREWRIGEE